MAYTLFSNRDLRRLIVPLAIEQALYMTVNAADTMMVAELGEASVSGVSVIGMFDGFIGNVFFALATGGAVVASQFIGAKEDARARSSAKQLLGVALLFSSIIMVGVLLFKHQIIRLIFGNLEPDVMDAAIHYITITACSYPFVCVYGSGTALCRSMSKANVTMKIAFLSNIINICGNALLIFKFGMGVRGAALATLLARVFSMLAIIFVLTNKGNKIYLTFRDGFRFSWEIVRKILFIGIPSGIENGIFQMGRLLVVGLIAKYGTKEIAANAVANTIDYVGCMAGSAFSLATITVIGQSVGAGIEAQVRYYVKKMMKCAYIAHAAWNIILLAFTPLILNCFSKIGDDTRHLALILILIHNVIGMLLWPSSFVFPNVLRATNDVRFTMVASVGSMFVIRIGCSYALAHFIGSGVISVWIAMILDWIVRTLLFYARYRSGAWKAMAKVK